MKKTGLCIFMIFFSLSTIGHASQFVSSRISEVTLYSNQAMIVREGRANLAPGMNELLIETTAYDMDKDALSAQVFGSGEMISVQLTSIPLSDFPQEQVRSIREKLRDMQRSRNILSDKKTVLAKQSSFLDSLIDFARTQIPKDVQTDKISVENIKDSSAVLKIIDRIPVSRTDKIEVRDVKMQPMPTHSNYQDKSGVHLWSLTLAPGQKQEIAIDFTVAYPKASTPYGL